MPKLTHNFTTPPTFPIMEEKQRGKSRNFGLSHRGKRSHPFKKRGPEPQAPQPDRVVHQLPRGSAELLQIGADLAARSSPIRPHLQVPVLAHGPPKARTFLNDRRNPAATHDSSEIEERVGEKRRGWDISSGGVGIDLCDSWFAERGVRGGQGQRTCGRIVDGNGEDDWLRGATRTRLISFDLIWSGVARRWRCYYDIFGSLSFTRQILWMALFIYK